MGIIESDRLSNGLTVNYSEISKKVYKLLPIYEGKIKGSNISIQRDVALSNFSKNLYVLTTEIRGILNEVEFHKNLSEVYAALVGLKGIDSDSHEMVRSVILHCVNLLNIIGG